MSIAQALCEQVVFDKDGRTMNPSFVDYLMPTINESMIAVLSAPFSSGGSIVGTFLRLGSEAGTVTAVPKLSAIRREYKNRDDAIRVAYESGAYSYQQIAKQFKVHFATVGRIVRQPKKRVSVITGRR